jgi:hypothetical protein
LSKSDIGGRDRASGYVAGIDWVILQISGLLQGIDVKTIKALWVISMLLLTTACITTKPPSELLLGSWQTQVGGFPVTVDYTAVVVSVDGQAPITYQLTGDRLQMAEGGSQVRILQFPSTAEMIQTDPMTGSEHRFNRQL